MLATLMCALALAACGGEGDTGTTPVEEDTPTTSAPDVRPTETATATATAAAIVTTPKKRFIADQAGTWRVGRASPEVGDYPKQSTRSAGSSTHREPASSTVRAIGSLSSPEKRPWPSTWRQASSHQASRWRRTRPE